MTDSRTGIAAAPNTPAGEAQLGSREILLHDRKQRVYFRRGTSDESVFHEIFVNNAYDPGRHARAADLRSYFEAHAVGGRKALVVDAGANVGAAAIFFQAIFRTARVVAIEPAADNFRLLERNTAGLDVRCVQAAVASTVGLARVVDPGGGPWAYRTAAVEDGPPASGSPADVVQRVTINGVFATEAEGAFPFLVKIDIEGAEADLFTRNVEWIDRTPLIIIELHDWMFPRQGISSSFLKCMAARDRDFIPFGQNIFSFANRPP